MNEKKLNSYLARQLERKLIREEDIEVYKYGYILVMELGIHILITVIIGIITGWLSIVLFFLLAFIPLRTYCGGYHATSFIGCAILSNLLTTIVVAIVVLWNPNIILLAIIECISVVVILLNAPCQCTNKPISSEEAEKYKKIIRVILVAEIIVALNCLFWNFDIKIVELITMTHFIIGIGVLVGRWKT